jgi:hypothetical protein
MSGMHGRSERIDLVRRQIIRTIHNSAASAGINLERGRQLEGGAQADSDARNFLKLAGNDYAGVAQDNP